MADQVPPIFCINLRDSTDRRKRMEHRFKVAGLENKVTFINAIRRDSPLIEYYHNLVIQQYPDTRKWRSEMACFASHLKAIRTFLEEGGEEALICEDDIMLRNDFVNLWPAYRQNFPDNCPLVTFSYMIEKWEGYHFTGKNPNLKNILTLDPKNTWGAQLYWISKDWAIKALLAYDKPYRFLNCQHTSEVILRYSNGYLAYPPMAIEEGIDSERAPEDMPFHHNHFGQWGYKNFNLGEIEDISPLAKK